MILGRIINFLFFYYLSFYKTINLSNNNNKKFRSQSIKLLTSNQAIIIIINIMIT
jgi:hypothetical protein